MEETYITSHIEVDLSEKVFASSWNGSFYKNVSNTVVLYVCTHTHHLELFLMFLFYVSGGKM